jgi:hypothetical protein
MTEILDYIFLQTLNPKPEQNLQNLDNDVHFLIQAILNKDVGAFNQIESAYSRKNPVADSPWINNNYLIFLLLIGQQLFLKDSTWLKKAIEVRRRSNEESSFIYDFFISISVGSPNSKGQFAPLYLTYCHLSNKNAITVTLINNSLEELCSIKRFPCYDNEFLNIIYLAAFEICLRYKVPIDVNSAERLSLFKTKIQKRVSSLANIIVYAGYLVLMIGIWMFIKKVFYGLTESWQNRIITIASFAGLTILEIFKARITLRKSIEKSLYSYLGINLLTEGFSDEQRQMKNS